MLDRLDRLHKAALLDLVQGATEQVLPEDEAVEPEHDIDGNRVTFGETANLKLDRIRMDLDEVRSDFGSDRSRNQSPRTVRTQSQRSFTSS